MKSVGGCIWKVASCSAEQSHRVYCARNSVVCIYLSL